MKRELLTASALSSMAFAGSCPARADVFNWTGFYIGGQAGYGSLGSSTAGFQPIGGTYALKFRQGALTSGIVTYPAVPAAASFGSAGVTGGGTLGYNWQTGAFVYGGEADFSSLSIRGSFVSRQIGPTSTSYVAAAGTDWLSTVRARIGFAQDRLLVFATGGFAFGGTHLASSSAFSGGLKSAFLSGAHDEVRLGYALGGGIEYAITNHLSLKLEGLYYDLGSGSVIATGKGALVAFPLTIQPYQVSYHFDGAIALAGINYRF